jgi:perosamine synthetase
VAVRRKPRSRLDSRGGKGFPSWPQITEADVEAVTAVLRSNRLSLLTSSEVEAFEEEFAAYHGVRHCVAVNSGTSAVHLALAAVGVTVDDHVAVPAHTFVGSAAPVCYLGARPLLVDIDRESFCMSPDDLAAKITPQTRAIVPVHLNGMPADLDGIMRVAADHRVPVVEDACQAVGARFNGSPVGSFGAVSCFSFWEDKTLTMGGEGGAVLTNDDDMAERIRRLRNHGHGPLGRAATACLEVGYSDRPTAMQAALGRSQLGRLDAYVGRRRENAEALREQLGDIAGLQLPTDSEARRSGWWKFVVRVEDTERLTASELIERLRVWGIPAAPRYPVPLSRQPGLLNRFGRPPDCPIAEALSTQLFSLPVHPAVTERHIALMADAILTELE